MGNITIMTMATIYTVVPITLMVIAALCRGQENELITVMKPHKFFMYLGIVGDLIFIGGVIGYTLQRKPGDLFFDIFVYTVSSVLILMGLYLILYPINWRLIFDDEKLIHKNWLGIKRSYKYSDITGIRAYYARKQKTPEKYKIYIGKRKITVEYLVENFGSFERTIKKRLKNAKNPIKIEVKRAKS